MSAKAKFTKVLRGEPDNELDAHLKSPGPDIKRTDHIIRAMQSTDEGKQTLKSAGLEPKQEHRLQPQFTRTTGPITLR